MSGQQGYSHIKVTSSEADEEVIVAGRPSASIDDTSDDAAMRSAIAHSQPMTDDSASQSQAQVQNDRTRDGSIDRYHPTTIEEINSFKMSTMQKAIIAFAIIAIIAFVIYMVTG